MKFKIPLTRFEVTEEQKKVTKEILESTMFTEGKWVKKFEKAVSDYIGTKYCIACANGTAALMLIFTVLRTKGYKRVVVPALTFPATLNAALLLNYNSILKDVSDTDPFLIDEKGIEKQTRTFTL